MIALLDLAIINVFSSKIERSGNPLNIFESVHKFIALFAVLYSGFFFFDVSNGFFGNSVFILVFLNVLEYNFKIYDFIFEKSYQKNVVDTKHFEDFNEFERDIYNSMRAVEIKKRLMVRHFLSLFFLKGILRHLRVSVLYFNLDTAVRFYNAFDNYFGNLILEIKYIFHILLSVGQIEEQVDETKKYTINFSYAKRISIDALLMILALYVNFR